MLKLMPGRVLGSLFRKQVVGVQWDDDNEHFIVSELRSGEAVTLAPDELADLARELLWASVTKGAV